MNKKRFLGVLCCFGCLVMNAQTLSIDEAQAAAQQQYPLIKQRALLERSGQYSLENLAKGLLPQLTVSGQASNQSDVTTLPITIPGVAIEPLSKDQYRIMAEATQPITDLLTVSKQREVQRAANAVAMAGLETNLYALRNRVDDLYFGILVLTEQLQQQNLASKDIQAGMAKVTAAIAAGTDYRTSLDKLKAQLLDLEERALQLQTSRKAYIAMLAQFTGQELTDSVQLYLPALPARANNALRPELRLYDQQEALYQAQAKLAATRSLPKLSGFVQGGYGRPGLNLLSNDFKPWYLYGLRLNWSVTSLYTLHKERQILALNRAITATERDAFLFNNRLSLAQQHADLDGLLALVAKDGERLQLRQSIKRAALAQLEQGVITVNDYIREVDAEQRAAYEKTLHEIQRIAAEYRIQNTIGQP